MSEDQVIQTFNIRTGPNKADFRPHPFVDSFDAHGHEWVIHRRLYRIGYGVSHKASGFAVPGVETVRPEEAKVKAMAFLDAKKDQIAKVVAEVMK